MKNHLQQIFLGLMLLTFLQACVQQEHAKTVTFKVDMNGITNVANVGLRGQFTSPSWQVTIPMTDTDGDGIYEVTLEEKTAQNSVSFKFVNQSDQVELACQENRRITFDYRPETIEYSAVFDSAESGIQTHN
ncbi:hypothetical protein ABV409_09190 [Flagellimonas sp. DF-77]|uniref:hypothetical protein n=1 Tax=Flagellimonas algarum TaxID=3230298 RepID=UPI0033991C24